MFYFDSDKIEIKGWIKRDILILQSRIEQVESFQNSSDIFAEVEKYVLNQLRQNNEEYIAQISILKREIENLKSKPDSTAALQAEISDLRNQNKNLEDKIAKLKTESTAALQVEILELRNQNKILSSKNFALETEITKIWQEIKKFAAEKISVQAPVQIPIQEKIQPQIQIKPESKIKISPPPLVETPEEIFYLPNNEKVFITDNREKILEKIRQALKAEEIQNFLVANNSETSKKFQKLIKVHLQGVQNFINKLKLDDLDDEELSETVTSKYFKLFHQIIFDNFLVAIKRGLNSAEKNFYLELLKKTNEYLSRAGIYAVNAKSNVKVSDEDFENMTAQIVKTADKNKIDFIKEIERLPYRINYLDEFGEQKYFQYNGVMTIFKAVR